MKNNNKFKKTPLRTSYRYMLFQEIMSSSPKSSTQQEENEENSSHQIPSK